MSKHKPLSPSLLDPALLRDAALQALVKLDPRSLWRNPVMFVTATVAAVSTVIFLRALLSGGGQAGLFLQVALWLWFTVWFGNLAEAMAEGRGKAQAASLRQGQAEMMAKKLGEGGGQSLVPAKSLRAGDLVLVETGDPIPGDGDVVEGIAAVDESAITGESAPVIRESGGDRSAVTGGTKVLSDWIKVRITVNPGESFLDRMIGLVEGAKRQKTPNEIALTVLLVGMTLIFLVTTGSLEALAIYSGVPVPVVYLIALLVALIPTTIGGLLSAIGIAGMDRLIRHNVVAKSGRAVEAAGDVDTLLLDKTGTITFGNRMAAEFVPLSGVNERALATAAMLASVADETPEGKSIVVLAGEKYGIHDTAEAGKGTFVPFTAQSRMSGLDLGAQEIRKGAVDAVLSYCGRTANAGINAAVERIAKAGGTPLLVAVNREPLGVVYLKDIVKSGIRERFAELRRMGIRTVMITGDNPLTAAAIAAEAGVDDFVAEATPEKKLSLIRSEQGLGKLVAMCGDGTNDAPALAQADVGLAMNIGTAAAREAGNMVDLDSNPTKLIEVVMIGKQLLMSRGSLTTFSLANDVAKYFAIIPALFAAAYPQLGVLNVMRLASPESAILSAVIFNALIIVCLIPLALKGVRYRPLPAAILLRRNLLVYGLGGLVLPFIGIKAVDLLVTALGLA